MTNENPKPETGSKKKEAKSEKPAPLKVEVHFPAISDLKQAIGFDSDGNLIIKLQFTSRVDQYEIFRLVNLLKQPHGTLFATIGSPQSAMDFIFDPKKDRMDILKAASQIVAAKTDAKGDITPQIASPITIQEVKFNYIETEKLPYGVFLNYFIDGAKETKSGAGRGKNPTQAVIASVKQIGAVAAELNEPFEIVEALKGLKEEAAVNQLIRTIEVGSFDPDEEGKSKPKGE